MNPRLLYIGISIIFLLSFGSSCKSKSTKDELYDILKRQIKIIDDKLTAESAAPVAFFDGITLKNDTLIYKMTMAPQPAVGGIDLVSIYKENPDIIRKRAKNAMAYSFSTHDEIMDLMP